MGVKKLWWSFSSVGNGWPDSFLQSISSVVSGAVLIGTVAAKKSSKSKSYLAVLIVIESS